MCLIVFLCKYLWKVPDDGMGQTSDWIIGKALHRLQITRDSSGRTNQISNKNELIRRLHMKKNGNKFSRKKTLHPRQKKSQVMYASEVVSCGHPPVGKILPRSQIVLRVEPDPKKSLPERKEISVTEN